MLCFCKSYYKLYYAKSQPFSQQNLSFLPFFMIISYFFNHLYGIQCINEYFNKTAPTFSIGAVKFFTTFSFVFRTFAKRFRSLRK